MFTLNFQMAKKPFLVVEFADNTASVIPESWAYKDLDGQLMCSWTASSEKIRQLQPPNPGWPRMQLLRIVARKGRYR